MNITAIILNYKNYQDVCACIESLEKQDLNSEDSLKILIIDNNSEDGSTEKLKQQFPQHSYIFNKKNFGFAKGVNQGIDLSYNNSDYFLLVNNDAELSPDCLKKLLETSKGNDLIGPTIFYKQNPEIIWQEGGYFLKNKMGITIPRKNKKLISEETKNVDFISGCIMLIPKKIIDTIGKFDENFFFYGEDLDFCLRAKKAGFSIIYRADAKSWHNIKSIAENRTNPFVLKNLAYSYLLIIKKHFYNRRFYGLILFIFIYTPFRFYQIIKGKNNWRNLESWLQGGWLAWHKKI